MTRKKLSTKLTKHATSQSHLNCMIKWENYKQITCSGSVVVKLSESHKSMVERNKSYLCKVVNIIKLLSRLGQPFHGHREYKDSSESRGHFLEVCSFFSKYDTEFEKMHATHFNYTSPDFQNEIIEI